MEEHLITDRYGKLSQLWWYERSDEHFVFDALAPWRHPPYAKGYVLDAEDPPRAGYLEFSREKFRFPPQGVERVGTIESLRTVRFTVDMDSCEVSDVLDVQRIERLELRDVGMMDAMVARFCELTAASR